MRKLFISALAFLALPLFAQKEASIRVYPQQGTQQISKHIYGQFAEHLGTCIYGGLWVGPDSDIPNTQGYRNDVLNALKKLQIPNLRWPGGCFARKRTVRKWSTTTGAERSKITVSEPMSSSTSASCWDANLTSVPMLEAVRWKKWPNGLNI